VPFTYTVNLELLYTNESILGMAVFVEIVELALSEIAVPLYAAKPIAVVLGKFA
jgi:hypothetical protein